MKNSDQVKQWGAAEDDFLAPEIGVVESFLGSPFSTQEEDEVEKRDEMTAARNQYIADVSRKAMAGVIDGLSPATDPFSNEDEDEEWEKIERRMDTIGQNGNGAEHYDAPVLSKYHVLINGKLADFYDIIVAYGITNPADQHAVKKMLRPGKRGSKDGIQDRREAIASLQRAIELEGGL